LLSEPISYRVAVAAIEVSILLSPANAFPSSFICNHDSPRFSSGLRSILGQSIKVVVALPTDTSARLTRKLVQFIPIGPHAAIACGGASKTALTSTTI